MSSGNVIKIKKPITRSDAIQKIDNYIYGLPRDQVRTPVLYVANYQSIHDLQIIELNKLTMLFGPNSSGKSAIADALEDLSNALIGETVKYNRFHWGADKDKEVLVLGIGGIMIGPTLYSEYTRKGHPIVSENLNLYIQINKSYHGPGYIDILLCLDKDTEEGSVNFWKDQLRMARFGFASNDGVIVDPPIIYIKDDLQKIIDNDYGSDDFSEHAAEDVPYLFEDNDMHNWSLNGIEGDDRDQEMYSKGFTKYAGIENENVRWGNLKLGGIFFLTPRHETLSGKMVNFFLLSFTEQISRHIKKSARLGPLRIIPTVDDLNFENIATIKHTKDYKDHVSAVWSKLFSETREIIPNSNGIEYWKKIAENICKDASLYTNLNTELLNEVNHWLTDDKKFNSGLEISAKITASQQRQSLPLDKNNLGTTDDYNYSIHVEMGFQSAESKESILPVDVGVGMSQLIPVIVSTMEEKQLFIEQPELHLHPSMQLVVADLIISRLNKVREKNNFNTWLIAETHSEHIMLRLLRRIRESATSDIYHRDYSLKPDEISVYFVNPSKQGTSFKKIRIDEEGDFIDEWPDGFFEESFYETFAGR